MYTYYFFTSFKYRIDYHVDIVNKLQQKVLKLLRVQDQGQDPKVILQPFFINKFIYITLRFLKRKGS